MHFILMFSISVCPLLKVQVYELSLAAKKIIGKEILYYIVLTKFFC